MRVAVRAYLSFQISFCDLRRVLQREPFKDFLFSQHFVEKLAFVACRRHRTTSTNDLFVENVSFCSLFSVSSEIVYVVV